jgi:H+/Cl- antiporter ClcA
VEFLSNAINDIFRSKSNQDGSGLALFLIFALPLAGLIFFASVYYRHVLKNKGPKDAEAWWEKMSPILVTVGIVAVIVIWVIVGTH